MPVLLYLRYLAYFLGLLSIILNIYVTHAEFQESHIYEQQQQHIESPVLENLEPDSSKEV